MCSIIMMEWIEISIGIFCIALGIYYWSTWNFDFWSTRGVSGPLPLPLVGNFKDVLFGKMSIGEYFKYTYDDYRDEKIIGIFMRREPVLVLIDPDIIKDVLIKDFAKFSDRGFNYDKTEPLSQHLLNLETARWRPLRKQLTNIFTSGKLKKMFYLLDECGDNLTVYLEELLKTGEIIEVYELTAKYTTDVIGSCVFGLRINALADENSEFRKMGKQIFTFNWKRIAKFRFQETAPWLYEILAPLINDRKVTDFFLKIMRETMDYRRKNGIVKHDFFDLMMELKDHPDRVSEIEVTDTLLTAQLFIFFLAGFETSATTMTNTLYELAQHQPIQDKLRNEINFKLTRIKNGLDYDSIKAMTYLDMVFKETLRKYPPATTLTRQATDAYTFNGIGLTIPKNTKIIVPVFGIHRDLRIYNEPEIFDPERFTNEAMKARHTMSWLAFGEGPRNCIASRFADYQTKVGLIKILQNHKVELCEKTEIPYVINPRSFLLAPKNGIYLRIHKIR